MTTQQMHLGDVLSVTTGKLVSPDHVGGIYRILGHMTGQDLFTHQLPRAMRACAPVLLEQHPQLRDVQTPDWDSLAGEEAQAAVDAWLAEQVAEHGETLPVAPLPAGAFEVREPVAELVEMMGPERVVPVLVAGEPPARS